MIDLKKLITVNRDNISTRELIVSLLFREWPLSTASIFNKLRREKAFGGSYQAVHKHLQRLLRQGIVSKTGGHYQINQPWLENIGSQIDCLKQKYRENNTEKPIVEIPIHI